MEGLGRGPGGGRAATLLIVGFAVALVWGPAAAGLSEDQRWSSSIKLGHAEIHREESLEDD